jgi:hypothetical protein
MPYNKMKILVVSNGNPSKYLVGAIVKAGANFERISKKEFRENLGNGANVGKVF